MAQIYYIGGSPSSGKSTVTEIISKKNNLYYFKVDNYLDEYIRKAVKQGKPVCKRIDGYTDEQKWMRSPAEQNSEEQEMYREVFELVQRDMKKVKSEKDMIVEGAPLLPQIMKELGVDQKHYINLCPTPDFQISHYKDKSWVPYVLGSCADKEKAFDNWMQRDILFAEDMRSLCFEYGYKSIENDGAISIDNLVKQIAEHFGLTY